MEAGRYIEYGGTNREDTESDSDIIGKLDHRSDSAWGMWEECRYRSVRECRSGRRGNTGSTGTGAAWNGRNVDSAEFYELYTALMSVFIREGTAPAITQNYYAYDDIYASVQVNGTEFFLVSRAELQQLQRRIAEAF